MFTDKKVMPKLTKAFSLATLLALLAVIPALAAAPPYGLTWTKNADYGSFIRVGCSGCDPYDGDTACSVALPILCIYVSGAPDPDPSLSSYYNGWSEGHVAISTPVKGDDLFSLTNANSICEGQFGAGWRMAEFHDGDPNGNGAGWNFRAYGSVPDYVRFWVHINDQTSNCWD